MLKFHFELTKIFPVAPLPVPDSMLSVSVFVGVMVRVPVGGPVTVQRYGLLFGMQVAIVSHGPLGPLHLLFTQDAMIIGQAILVFPVMAAYTLAAVQGAAARLREEAFSPMSATTWSRVMSLDTAEAASAVRACALPSRP